MNKSLQLHNRSGDRVGRSSKGHIAKLAFVLTSVLIILASISLLFIGLVASREADRQASVNQQLLLDIALKNRFDLIARDQLSLARWDESVRSISRYFDPDFVADEFMDSLWFDFSIDRNLLIGPDNRVVAESLRDDVQFDTRQLDVTNPILILVEQARALFFKHRIVIGDGYGQERVSATASGKESVHGFLLLDDQVVMINAMAIVPDDGNYSLPDGNPVILLSAIYLDEELIGDLNSQLSFTNMQFTHTESLPAHHQHHSISSLTGEPMGSFSWSSAMPGRQIWQTVIPVIIVLGSFLALVAFAIAWKIGHLTLSLATSEQHNYYLAMHDTLSGLANRLQFNRALEAAVQSLSTTPFTLIQCDLDRFKNVNDTLGHAAGDTVIKTVAQRLSEAVGAAGLVGRVGGDEFVILLPGCNEFALVQQLAETIISDICRPIETDSGDYAEIGISLGVAFGPRNGTTGEALMGAADAALYMAKDLGRNRAIFADTVNTQNAELGQGTTED
jgi:diguanylate cyclase (GGDEF)-like protein